MFAAGLLFGLASGIEAAGRLGVDLATRMLASCSDAIAQQVSWM